MRAMENKVVVLIRTSSVARAPVYAHLRSLGVKLIVVHPVSPLAEFDGIFSEWLQCETYDVALLRAALESFLSEKKLHADAIISFDEYGVYPAAVLAESFHLRAIPLSARRLRQTNNKARFRRFCQRHAISSPRSRKLHCATFIEKLMYGPIEPEIHEQLVEYMTQLTHDMQFPLIMKPSVGAGSLLVRQCTNVHELTLHAIESWRVLLVHPDSAHFQTVHAHDMAAESHSGDYLASAVARAQNPAHCISSDENDVVMCYSPSEESSIADRRTRPHTQCVDDALECPNEQRQHHQSPQHYFSLPLLAANSHFTASNICVDGDDASDQTEQSQVPCNCAVGSKSRCFSGNSKNKSSNHAPRGFVESPISCTMSQANGQQNAECELVNDTHTATSLSHHEYSSASSNSSYCRIDLLVEEFIHGTEVDMDCVLENGILRFCAISDNFAPAYPFFAEVGGLCPSSLGLQEQTALRDLLLSFVHAHGTNLHGVLHFEAKYDPTRGKAYVIEVNNRLGSAETNTMILNAYNGLQLGESLVRCALHMSIVDQLAQHFPALVPPPPYLPSSQSTSSHTSYLAEGNNADTEERVNGRKEGTPFLVTRAPDGMASDNVHAPLSVQLAVPNTDEETHISLSHTQQKPQHNQKHVCDVNGLTRSQAWHATGGYVKYFYAGTVDPNELGGASCGFFPATSVSASVNVYPTKDGELRGYRILSEHKNLVTYSIAPIGTRLLSSGMSLRMTGWIVARGRTCKEAQDSIRSLTDSFQQDID